MPFNYFVFVILIFTVLF